MNRKEILKQNIKKLTENMYQNHEDFVFEHYTNVHGINCDITIDVTLKIINVKKVQTYIQKLVDEEDLADNDIDYQNLLSTPNKIKKFVNDCMTNINYDEDQINDGYLDETGLEINFEQMKIE